LKDDILEPYLHDEKNARIMHSDGTYARKKHANNSLDGQAYFIEHPAGSR
jgi:hypothetical protein